MRHQRNLRSIQTCSEPAPQPNIVVTVFGFRNQDKHRQAIEIRPLEIVGRNRKITGRNREIVGLRPELWNTTFRIVATGLVPSLGTKPASFEREVPLDTS